MPRTSGTGRKTRTGKSAGRRSRWTDEQIAEWRQRDRDIMEASTGYLEDADQVREFAGRAAAGRVSARILGYSLRNQMLLDKQAAERGFVLTDVASAKEWRERGRGIKLECKGQSLRLVAPRGKQKKDAEPDQDDVDATADSAADTDDEPGDPEEAPKTRFRTVAVFDIAQTDGASPDNAAQCPDCFAEPGEACTPHCACGACVAFQPDDEDSDAADIVWNKLLAQVDEHGYAFDWPAPAAVMLGDRVRVDHSARTVYAALNATADAPEAVADLAAALAEIIARDDRARAARRAEREAARHALTAH